MLNQILIKLLEQAPEAIKTGFTNPLAANYDESKIAEYRSLFPSYRKQADLIYLDSAATSLRPQLVADSFLESFSLYGNLERSSNASALKDKILDGKQKLLAYLFPQAELDHEQLVYTSGTTEAINLIANGLANYWQQQLATLAQNLAVKSPSDSTAELDYQASKPYYILVSGNNHNSNLLPWLQLSKRLPQIKVLAINFTEHPFLNLKQANLLKFNNEQDFLQNYHLADLASILAYLKQRVLLVSASSVTNVTADLENLGLIKNLLTEYSPDCFLLVDHAQGALFHNYQQKLAVAQQKLGWSEFKLEQADFLVTSLHKMQGLTGIGVLYTSKRIMQLQDSFANRAEALLAKFNLLASEAKQEEDKLGNECLAVTANQRSLNLQFSKESNYLQPTLLGGGVVDFIRIEPEGADYKLSSENPFAIAGTCNIANLVTVADTIDFLAQYQEQEAEIYQYQTAVVQQAYQEILNFRNLVLAHCNFIAEQSSLDSEAESESGKEHKFLVYDLKPIPTQIASYHLCLQLVNREDELVAEPEFNFSQQLAAALNLNPAEVASLLPSESLESFLPSTMVYRNGKHCAYQLFNYLNSDGCYRFSFAYYNKASELEQVVKAVKLYLAQNLFL